MARFVWFLILAFGMGAFGQAPTRVVPTLSALDALKPGTTQPFVLVEGLDAGRPFAGGPKSFRWDSTNALPTNAIRRGTATGVGRWVHDWDGDVQVFGARGDGSNDDSDALNAAFANVDLSKDRRIVLPKTEQFFKISKQLVFTNSNATIDWLGKVRCADGVSYHILMFGTNPTFDADGRPQPVHSNLVVNGYGVGEFDGNSHNALEYFPVSTAAVYGGHGFNFVGYDNVQLNGMVVRDVPNWAVNFQRCVRFKALDNTVLTGMGNNSTNWNGKNQDGIHMVDSWDGVVSGNWVRSSDDNYAVTCGAGNVRNIVISDNIGEHNMLESTSFQAGGQYFALGMNVRVTTDVAVTNYIENIVVSDNIFYGGNGGFTLQNAGSDSNQVRQILFLNNQFHSKTNLGGNGFLGTSIGFISRAYDVSIRGNAFQGNARTIYIQDGSLIDVSGNTWDGDVANSNIVAAVTIDGSTSTLTDNRKLTINYNRFNGTYRSAVRGTAFNSGGARVFHDVEVRGNQFLNGPQDTSRFAVQLTGFGGRVVVDENVFQNWVGGGVLIHNPESHVSLSGNSWIDCTDATLPMTQILTTNGMLIPYVAVRDNVVFRHGSGFDIRNVEVLDVEGNSVVSAQQQAPSSSFFALIWTGDGSGTNPVTTGIRGRFQNNFVSRTNTAGSAVAVTYNSMPTYAGSAFYVRGNRVVGMTTPFSTANTSLFPDYEPFDQRPMFGAFVPTFGSYFRYLDQASTNGGAAFSVDRTITVNDSLSSDVAAFSAINRLGGSGTNSTQVRAGVFTSSQDRTNDVSEVRALEAQARLTSSGGAGLARAFYGQLVGQSNGVITLGAAFTAGSPSLAGGSTVGSSVGVAIEQQAVPGVTNGFAIRQAGTNDINAFMSPLYLGALGTNTPLVFGGTAAPTLSAANGSLYLRTDGTMYQMTNGVWTLR